MPRTVAAAYLPSVRNVPFPLPHSFRVFFFAAAVTADFLAFGQLSSSVNVSVVNGFDPFVWLILNSPS